MTLENKAIPKQYFQTFISAAFNFGIGSPTKIQKKNTTRAPKAILRAATCIGVKDSKEILTARNEKPQMKPKKINKDQLLTSLLSVLSDKEPLVR
tara:strand:+ start:124 stop:408 length:285 start_codon:yes stop_codon:yes gene_type:complete